MIQYNTQLTFSTKDISDNWTEYKNIFNKKIFYLRSSQYSYFQMIRLVIFLTLVTNTNITVKSTYKYCEVGEDKYITVLF